MVFLWSAPRPKSFFITFPSLYFRGVIYNQSRPFRPLVYDVVGFYSMRRGGLGGLATGAGSGTFCGGGNDVFLRERMSQICVSCWDIWREVFLVVGRGKECRQSMYDSESRRVTSKTAVKSFTAVLAPTSSQPYASLPAPSPLYNPNAITSNTSHHHSPKKSPPPTDRPNNRNSPVHHRHRSPKSEPSNRSELASQRRLVRTPSIPVGRPARRFGCTCCSCSERRKKEIPSVFAPVGLQCCATRNPG